VDREQDPPARYMALVALHFIFGKSTTYECSDHETDRTCSAGAGQRGDDRAAGDKRLE